MQFVTKKNKQFDMQVPFANKHITNIHITNFLRSTIETPMTWKDHTKELNSKLHNNSACNAIKSINPFVSLNVLIMIYFCYIHSIISYGIVFCGNSYNSQCIFIIQKIIIRVIMNTNKRDSCRELFKQSNYLTTPVPIYTLHTHIYHQIYSSVYI